MRSIRAYVSKARVGHRRLPCAELLPAITCSTTDKRHHFSFRNMRQSEQRLSITRTSFQLHSKPHSSSLAMLLQSYR